MMTKSQRQLLRLLLLFLGLPFLIYAAQVAQTGCFSSALFWAAPGAALIGGSVRAGGQGYAVAGAAFAVLLVVGWYGGVYLGAC